MHFMFKKTIGGRAYCAKNLWYC